MRGVLQSEVRYPKPADVSRLFPVLHRHGHEPDGLSAILLLSADVLHDAVELLADD